MSITPVTSETTLVPKQLLDALKPWVRRLVDDLRSRAEDEAAVGDELRAEYDAEFKAGRTGDAYGAWLEGALTQAAVAWILATVFIRFLEDNRFIEPRLSGPGDRREHAIEHETAFYAEQRTGSVTDYMLATFEGLRRHQATALLFDPAHVPLWRLRLSGDAARDLLGFWRKQDPDTGKLVFDFTSDELDTRFLGDLYQDLSEYARKKYALLQTPVFVEEFILDRTLEPAIETFGLEEVRMIDPTCGSGHFLLGGFERLLAKWRRQEPGTNPTVLVRRALDAVYGVDINPYAVAVARFRLLVAALREAGIRRLADELDLPLSIAVGDTLLCAPERQNSLFEQEAQREHLKLPGLTDYEDATLLTRVFGQRYHAVVGNPPYITVKDKVLNEAYRKRYPDSCHMKYSLGVPFTEVFFRLAVEASESGTAGYVGLITSDSFMKREFGKKLTENFIPKVDLTHVVSTSGAYIPGHGTPTVILYGRNRQPANSQVRVVMSVQGEPATPENPAKGLVWMAILEQIDHPGSESPFISVANIERDILSQHPWSIGGGGAVEAKIFIEEKCEKRLSHFASSIGVALFTLEDEAYILPQDYFRRRAIPEEEIRPIIQGDFVRDWSAAWDQLIVFPYSASFAAKEDGLSKNTMHHLWPYRAKMSNSKMFGGKTKVESGLKWFQYGRLTASKFQTALTIPFAFVATHNHFALSRGEALFKETSRIIKLHPEISEPEHLNVIGCLNSSTGCFWIKQVCQNRGSTVDQQGARQRTEPFEDFFEIGGGLLGLFPLPDLSAGASPAKLDELAIKLRKLHPQSVLQSSGVTNVELDTARAKYLDIRMQMIAWQEELDWHCYTIYGLMDATLEHPAPPPLAFGERAFEIALARQVIAGEVESTWFSRHGAEPVTELPAHWPEDYRQVVERRLAVISQNPQIRLIEQPTYKRRWNQPAWEEMEHGALRNWILDRLESPRYWSGEPAVRSVRELATMAAQDIELVRAVELYTCQAGAELFATIATLVASEAVPFLPSQRYTDSGKRKRAIWEDTWTLQRREDAGEGVGTIPAPPKYKGEDFQQKDLWRLRGALDVPKERFISYPSLEKLPDDSLVIGWAGWNHLDQATALAGFYDWASRAQGWESDRLIPLLAGVDELLPWLRQWHSEIDPATGTRPYEDFEAFLDEELRHAGLTRADLKAWAPPVVTKKRGRKRQT